MFKQDKAAIPSKADFDAEANFRKMMELLTPSQKFTVAANDTLAKPHLLAAFSKLVKPPQEKTLGQIWREAAYSPFSVAIAELQHVRAKTPGEMLKEVPNPYAADKEVSTVNKGEADFKKFAKFVLGK